MCVYVCVCVCASVTVKIVYETRSSVASFYLDMVSVLLLFFSGIHPWVCVRVHVRTNLCVGFPIKIHLIRFLWALSKNIHRNSVRKSIVSSKHYVSFVDHSPHRMNWNRWCFFSSSIVEHDHFVIIWQEIR